MKNLYTFLFLLAILLKLLVYASPPVELKTVKAIRLKEKVKIDGILEEFPWQEAGYSNFVQSDPIDGAEPSEKTIVWVAYSDDALYVAARLYDSEPNLIISRLGRRDDFVDSDKSMR